MLKKIIDKTFRFNFIFNLWLIACFTMMQNIMANPFETPVAMITSFDGNVNFENSTDRQVDFGTDIFMGDLLKTGINASLLVTFYNGCRQETVDQKSLIQVGKTQSFLRSGQFKEVRTLDCEIPAAILQETDSHLKAGLVIRGVKNAPKKIVSSSSFEITPLLKNNNFHLKAWTNHGKQASFKINDAILIQFLSAQDAYININYYSSNGEVFPLTSELLLKDNKIKAKQLYILGNKATELFAGLPTGIDTIQILISDQPIVLNDTLTDAHAYYQQLKSYIKNNKQQRFSEQLIRLTITQ